MVPLLPAESLTAALTPHVMRTIVNNMVPPPPPAQALLYTLQEASLLKSSLEQQIESTRESYQRQLSSLKEDIADREKQLRNHEQKYQEEQHKQNRIKLVQGTGSGLMRGSIL